MLHLHHNTWSRTAYSVTSQSSMLKIVYITKYSTYGFVKYDMHDIATYQNVQFMEYEAYHCLDLIAPQLDVLSWPYKWNVLHNGFIPNHFNPSLQMSKGRHKGKIQLSIGLPVQTAHPTYPMRSYFFKKINKNKTQFSILAKTLSAGYNNSTFLKFNTAQFLLLRKIERTEEKGREGENKKDKAAGEGGEKRRRRRRKEGYIYIPRSSTRTSGHEMQKLKINCWHLEKLIRGKNRRVYIKRAKHRW